MILVMDEEAIERLMGIIMNVDVLRMIWAMN